MELPPHIGKYELQEYLGGGMSRVYKARDTVLGRTVVVKVLTEAACGDEDARARFLQEARTVGNIVHENIIRVYDFGFDAEGHPYMVMEFLRGENLRTLIRQGRTGPLTRKLQIALEAARALEHIHAQSIIHRDIKPENVHINPDGAVKLMDFGIAKTADLSLTQPGLTMGTPYYMAPEQVLAKDITHLVDIYSFGVMLCELVTGVRPLTADTVEQIFYKLLHEPLNLEPLKQAGVPPALESLIARTTAKDPRQRPQSFTEVRRELEGILAAERRQSEAPEAPPERARDREPARRTWLLPTVAALLLGLFVAAYFAFRPSRPPLAAAIDTPAGRMVLVSAGPFLAGKDRHTETLPAFYIDQTEVTNLSYERYCAETKRPLPEGFAKDRPGYPVVNITFPDAREFARWAGKRLPMLLEWEKAARGTDGRLFPWGNERDPSRANVSGTELMPADSLPRGESPYHVRNMVGNAWEFVDQLQTPTPEAIRNFARLVPPATASEPWYTIRGGSYSEPLLEGAIYDWGSVPARYHNVNLGFRCVRDAR